MQWWLQFLILDFLLIATPLAYITFFERKKISIKNIKKEFGLEKGDIKKDLILSMQIFLSLIVFSAAISFILNLAGFNDFNPVKDAITNIVQSENWFWLTSYIFTIRVFGEEFFFRAFLVPRMGFFIPALLFGAMHITYGSIAEFIGATLLGLILGIAYAEKKRLLSNFVAHTIYNLVVFFIVLKI
jgi:membrane protease YdiL (CAAX protease family)